MINVIIAEDEYLIRERIKAIIPWQDLGYTITGEAEDGQEVIDYLDTLTVDVLILDIQMPFFTGLYILKYIAAKSMNVKVILATGYDKFEYAKEAIKYGAIGYLLKPIRKEELTELLLKAKELIEKDRNLTQSINHYNDLKEKQELLHAIKTNQSITEVLSKYKLALEGHSYIAFLELPIIEDFTHALTSEGLSCIILSYNEGHFTLLLTAQHSKNIVKDLEKLITIRLQQANIRIYVSDICTDAKELHRGYQQAKEVSQHRIFFNSKNVVSYEQLVETHNAENVNDCYKKLLPYCEELDIYIKTQNIRPILPLLDTLFTAIQATCNRFLLNKILLQLYFILQEKEISDPQVYLNHLINSSYSLNDIKSEVYKEIQCLIKNIKVPNALLVSTIKIYIEEHYTDSALSTEQIALYLGMNLSYISSLFKKTLGVSIVEYITKCRMERAKALLIEGHLKLYEIAAQIGYTDVFYFSKRFKKYFGTSPKNYFYHQK